MTKKLRPHRYLFQKAKLIRDATADAVSHPSDVTKREYLRGLCDGQHGTAHNDTANAIHVARQAIISLKETA